MKTVLVTGGTVFVSRFAAEHYVKKGYEVYVLNRNTRVQSVGVHLIQGDRHQLGDLLREHHFDVVIDTAYTAEDVNLLLDGLGSYGDYILISSSAVYPETGGQPFAEKEPVGRNKFWGDYGTDKIQAENALLNRNPQAYILRPPYLYGPMNNVYREAFVFDCAMAHRPFYLPRGGEMKLQFFHVEDLCRFMDVILEEKPSQHIFNVGNAQGITIRDWVALCYEAVGQTPEFVPVYEDVWQKNYFCFDDYEYLLDVTRQHELMTEEKELAAGLAEALVWYRENMDQVRRKPLMEYIDHELSGAKAESEK